MESREDPRGRVAECLAGETGAESTGTRKHSTPDVSWMRKALFALGASVCAVGALAGGVAVGGVAGTMAGRQVASWTRTSADRLRSAEVLLRVSASVFDAAAAMISEGWQRPGTDFEAEGGKLGAMLAVQASTLERVERALPPGDRGAIEDYRRRLGALASAAGGLGAPGGGERFWDAMQAALWARTALVAHLQDLQSSGGRSRAAGEDSVLEGEAPVSP